VKNIVKLYSSHVSHVILVMPHQTRVSMDALNTLVMWIVMFNRRNISKILQTRQRLCTYVPSTCVVSGGFKDCSRSCRLYCV